MGPNWLFWGLIGPQIDIKIIWSSTNFIRKISSIKIVALCSTIKNGAGLTNLNLSGLIAFPIVLSSPSWSQKSIPQRLIKNIFLLLFDEDIFQGLLRTSSSPPFWWGHLPEHLPEHLPIHPPGSGLLQESRISWENYNIKRWSQNHADTNQT